MLATLVLQLSGACALHIGGLRHQKSETAHVQMSMATGVLTSICKAYHSRGGVMLSVTYRDGPTISDSSGSSLRDDVPFFLFGSHTEVRGVIFDPASPPAVPCAYPSDASSYHRSPNQCGTYAGDPVSGPCRMPPSQYVDYEANFRRFRTCHFNTVEEMLDAQSAYWANRTGSKHLPIHIVPYNEVVLSEPEGHVAAFFWAHAGPFREPTRHDGHACALKNDYNCSDVRSSSAMPLFEIAELWEMELFMGSMCKVDFLGRFISCDDFPNLVVRNGEAVELIQKDLARVIRVMDPMKTICTLDCPQ